MCLSGGGGYNGPKTSLPNLTLNKYIYVKEKYTPLLCIIILRTTPKWNSFDDVFACQRFFFSEFRFIIKQYTGFAPSPKLISGVQINWDGSAHGMKNPEELSISTNSNCVQVQL